MIFLFNINFSDYSAFFDEFKLKYKNLKVLKGIEIGFQPTVIDETKNIIDSFDFDFVIGSVHIIDGMDPYTGNFIEEKQRNRLSGDILKKYISV